MPPGGACLLASARVWTPSLQALQDLERVQAHLQAHWAHDFRGCIDGRPLNYTSHARQWAALQVLSGRCRQRRVPAVDCRPWQKGGLHCRVLTRRLS